MAWQTPKTDWTTNPKNPTADDFNRIEGNIDFLKQDIETKKGKIVDALNTVGLASTLDDTYDTLANRIISSNQGTIIITPSTQNQTIPKGFHSGSGYVKGDPNLIANNIRNGVSIFGVVGSFKFQINDSISNVLYDNAINKQVPPNATPQLMAKFQFIETGRYALQLILNSSYYANAYGRWQIYLNNQLILDTGDNWGGYFPLTLTTSVFSVNSINDIMYVYGCVRPDINAGPIYLTNLKILGIISNLITFIS